jgi:hypothetical protein
MSPRRVRQESDVRYDDEQDMLVVLENQRYIPAIDSTRYHALATKKADIEKGDDQKDSLIW